MGSQGLSIHSPNEFNPISLCCTTINTSHDRQIVKKTLPSLGRAINNVRAISRVAISFEIDRNCIGKNCNDVNKIKKYRDVQKPHLLI